MSEEPGAGLVDDGDDRLPSVRELRAANRCLAAENERLRAELEAMRKDATIGALVRLKMTSGNNIAVERCTITATDIAVIDAVMETRKAG